MTGSGAFRARLLVLAVAACAGAACASALKPLDMSSELARVDPDSVDPARAARLAARAEELFALRPDPEAVREAEQLWLEAARIAPDEIEGIVGAVRARIWLAKHLARDGERKRIATAAVRTAQWCEVRAPAAAACPYYLALALGVQADARRATAVDGLKHMVAQLRRAIELDPTIDHGGPHRVLARVLVRAPGWPTGPGDPDEGLEQAQRAVEIDPDYPPNQLALAEAYLELDQPDAAREHYQRGLRLAITWQQQGDPDAADWIDEGNEGLRQTGGSPSAIGAAAGERRRRPRRLSLSSPAEPTGQTRSICTTAG